MFHSMYIDERVFITPSENNAIRSVDGYNHLLLDKLKDKHEGKCNANGYIRPGSIELLARSAPIAENGKFTGNYTYDCRFKCDILYPTAGNAMEAYVIKKNKMGVYAVYKEAIRILLPRESHLGNQDFDQIKLGDTIRIKIVSSRFQTNDPYISAVGTLVPSEEGEEVAEATGVAVAESTAQEDSPGASEEAPHVAPQGALSAIPEGTVEQSPATERPAVPVVVIPEVSVNPVAEVRPSATALLAGLPALPAPKRKRKIGQEEKATQEATFLSSMP
jgi:DNA-directed RNA polymerase subunit E'/Rpb7